METIYNFQHYENTETEHRIEKLYIKIRTLTYLPREEESHPKKNSPGRSHRGNSSGKPSFRFSEHRNVFER